MKKIQLLLLLLLSLTSYAEKTVITTHTSAPFTLNWQQSKNYFSIPASFHKGWVEVPENYAKPKGKKIHIFYYYRPAKKPSAPPMIFFNGGPGMTSYSIYKVLCERITDRDFIFIDQRGNGLSSSYPATSEKGVERLPLYLSRAIVQDAEALRMKLYGPNSRWSVSGSSFGAMIVQRYISLYPKSLISAHAHGYCAVDSPQQFPEIRLQSHRRALNRYLQTYPQDKKILQKIKDVFNSKDLTNMKNIHFTGDAPLDLIGFFMMSSEQYWQSLHNMIQRSHDNAGKINKDYWKDTSRYFAEEFLQMDGGQALVNITFNRVEGYCTGTKKSLTQFYQEIFDKLKKQGDDPRLWLLGEEALSHVNTHGQLFRYADTLPLKKLDPLIPSHIIKGLKKNPQLKLYLYSSGRDSVSPPEIFRDLTSYKSPQVIYHNFPESGHDGIITEDSIWQTVENIRYPSLKKAI